MSDPATTERQEGGISGVGGTASKVYMYIAAEGEYFAKIPTFIDFFADQ